ncbi:3-hydroxyacyl-ACP dehydratase FabZ [Thiohalospira sp.]|uniref:3-hydroxyacyl-ACP dehydratase FabZ n=1 Tax=Thiohalospira sp. TaxID=3080549 RepID=UPI00397F3262
MDIHQVLEHLPHRYPFLLIDRVLELEPGQRLLGLKNVTYNEPFFTGHFPQRPVMPGVLILEALAQATGVLAFRSTERRPSDGSLYFLVGIDNARFKQQVVPGDQVHLSVEVVRSSRSVWKFSGEARVDGQVAAAADLMCAERGVE